MAANSKLPRCFEAISSLIQVIYERKSITKWINSKLKYMSYIEISWFTVACTVYT